MCQSRNNITYGYLGVKEAHQYINNSNFKNLISNRFVKDIDFNKTNNNPIIVKYYFK